MNGGLAVPVGTSPVRFQPPRCQRPIQRARCPQSGPRMPPRLTGFTGLPGSVVPSGVCRFDGRVYGKDVGWEGNACEHADDHCELRRFATQAVQCAFQRVYGRSVLLRDELVRLCQTESHLGPVGILNSPKVSTILARMVRLMSAPLGVNEWQGGHGEGAIGR